MLVGLASAMAGVPTTALMRAMGHRSPIMTARYSEFADAERRWAFARADITNGIRLPGPRPQRVAGSGGEPGTLTADRHTHTDAASPQR